MDFVPGRTAASGRDESEPVVIPDSGSSTEVEEDEEDEAESHDPQLLMNSWAFSQRIAGQLGPMRGTLTMRRRPARYHGGRNE